MKSLELFSGAGGLALGLESAGFDHVGFVEFNPHACRSLRENFDERIVNETDVSEFDFETFSGVDIVAGGPPCQPFSLGGKHRADADDRDMFPHAARAIEVLQPKAFIFENVKGLLRSSFSSYFDYILARLAFPESVRRPNQDWQEHLAALTRIDASKYRGVKYRVSYKLLNAADYGVPQTRERVFVVGLRTDLTEDWVFPEPTHSKLKLEEDQACSNEYWDRHCIARPTSQRSIGDRGNASRQSQIHLFGHDLLPWRTVRDAIGHLPHPSERHDLPDHIYRGGARSYPGHTGSYVDAPAKTLKAGVHGVPGGENMIRHEDGSIRYFTVHEGKLLQTFPPDFVVTGSWGEAMRQIGNAVPNDLARTLGTQLHATISNQLEAGVDASRSATA